MALFSKNDKSSIDKAKSKASLMPKRKVKKVRKAVKRENVSNTFGSQPVDFGKFVYLPEGYENFFIFLYVLIVPYVTGLIFLFFFVAKTNVTNFTSMDLTTFFVVWAIGYEIVAAVLLVLIFYSAFRFKPKAKKQQTRQKRRDNSAFPKTYKFD
ncbi:MAG: hypothetical protein B5M52_01080 [Helicobacteraceae bacterium 4484_230]|nr:MAG: hypothetical protein B5M52_01080 [Helicobacteraceae bacterium 4484_230]